MNSGWQRGLATLLACLALGAFAWSRWRSNRAPANAPVRPASSAPAAAVGAVAVPSGGWLATREQHVEETVWAKEVLAQACGRTLESWWEAVIAATNRLAAVASFEFGEVSLGRWTVTATLPQGIRIWRSSGADHVLPGSAWPDWVERHQAAGWELAQLEIRHNRFETSETGAPRRSVFYFAAHLSRATPVERAIVEGDLVVDWLSGPTNSQPAKIRRVEASGLEIRTRAGEAPFECVLNERIAAPFERFSIDPLILQDLDGDGRSEILLPSVNALYRREATGRYRHDLLCRFPPGVIFTALVADFDGDGWVDLLCARAEGLVLYQGRAGMLGFDEPERLAWLASEPLRNPMALTGGDVDGDGDLDVFLGQYRVPTMGQVLKPWYYDANDGYPGYLLLNDGHGRFTDGTIEAGLAAKRLRRTYTASLVDLDGDGHLDLAVVSDFAGLDLYGNDGRGKFTDVTSLWVDDPKAFGMAHALADFNVDGRLDLLMIGMNSPTVDRLEHLGLRRPGSMEDFAMRPRMAFGNRLFLAREGAGFEQTRLNDALARSGWSWGCSAADFDNDGFPDVYAANGLQSQASVRDFEPEFWLHDIYVDEAVDDLEATRYFLDKFARTRGQGWSYGGHERNRLYLNSNGKSFVEAAWLMGVALPEDSRSVVTDDLDGDGRMDLLVTTFEVWPEVRQTLRVFANRLDPAEPRHWIGFRFPGGPGNPSPHGTRVVVTTGGRRAVRQLVTGDSHRAQHAASMHFGLGGAARVEDIEVRWPDGRETRLRNPATGRYHVLRAGDGSEVEGGPR